MMSSRRDFLRTLSGAALGACAIGDRLASGQGFREGTSGPRRAVVIGGKRIRVIDVHAHCVIPEGVELVKGTALAAAAAAAGGNTALGPARLAQLDGQGLDMQALSINFF